VPQEWPPGQEILPPAANEAATPPPQKPMVQFIQWFKPLVGEANEVIETQNLS